MERDTGDAHPPCSAVDGDHKGVTGYHGRIDEQGTDTEQGVAAEAHPVGRDELNQIGGGDTEDDEEETMIDEDNEYRFYDGSDDNEDDE